MNPLYSWVVVLAVIGGLAWHYTGRPNVLTTFTHGESPQAGEKVAEKPRGKRQKAKRGFTGEQVQNESRTSLQASSVEGTISKKRKIAPATVDGTTTAFDRQTPSQTVIDDDGGLSNEAFAKQFAQARAGTRLAPTSKQGTSKRERRANKAVAAENTTPGVDSPNLSAEASSATGADADDDLSPVGSPPLGATSTTVTSKAGDVSDMLQAPSTGPGVLRLTDSKGTMNKAKPKPAPKSFEVAETKKQRQARQKREAQKILNEEAEKERRMQMEKQIRKARMAEGSSAQTKSASFKVPSENAWFAGGHTQAVTDKKAAPAKDQALLDTFEPEIDSRTSGDGAINVMALSNIANRPTDAQSVEALKKAIGVGQTEALGASGRENGVEPGSSTQSNTSWADDLPSEEEQMRRIRQEDAWTTVANKKEKKKGGANPAGGNEVDTTSEASAEAARPNGTTKKPALSNGLAKKIESSNRFHSVAPTDVGITDTGFQNSDWAA